MSKEMFINAVDSEECRIAVSDDGELQELYIERSSLGHHVGNLYKGRVTNVEPSIQAAFIDYGHPKNGFLHVSDISQSYYPENMKSQGRNRPLIEKILKRGQEVIVQVTKEGLGTKGATMSTYLSIAGRYLVLMPG
ncbi:MAG: S1 RNA-binding domain-containing protein, partial [Anaerolineaceae bacterium]|nr:S1 RNA-binding domain-containing protein [Anaerolineaceae bacterium]